MCSCSFALEEATLPVQFGGIEACLRGFIWGINVPYWDTRHCNVLVGRVTIADPHNLFTWHTICWLFNWHNTARHDMTRLLIAPHVSTCPCQDMPIWRTNSNFNIWCDGHVRLTSGHERRETMKIGSFGSKKRRMDSLFCQLSHETKTEAYFSLVVHPSILYDF